MFSIKHVVTYIFVYCICFVLNVRLPDILDLCPTFIL